MRSMTKKSLNFSDQSVGRNLYWEHAIGEAQKEVTNMLLEMERWGILTVYWQKLGKIVSCG